MSSLPSPKTPKVDLQEHQGLKSLSSLCTAPVSNFDLVQVPVSKLGPVLTKTPCQASTQSPASVPGPSEGQSTLISPFENGSQLFSSTQLPPSKIGKDSENSSDCPLNFFASVVNEVANDNHTNKHKHNDTHGTLQTSDRAVNSQNDGCINDPALQYGEIQLGFPPSLAQSSIEKNTTCLEKLTVEKSVNPDLPPVPSQTPFVKLKPHLSNCSPTHNGELNSSEMIIRRRQQGLPLIQPNLEGLSPSLKSKLLNPEYNKTSSVSSERMCCECQEKFRLILDCLSKIESRMESMNDHIDKIERHCQCNEVILDENREEIKKLREKLRERICNCAWDNIVTNRLNKRKVMHVANEKKITRLPTSTKMQRRGTEDSQNTTWTHRNENVGEEYMTNIDDDRGATKYRLRLESDRHSSKVHESSDSNNQHNDMNDDISPVTGNDIERNKSKSLIIEQIERQKNKDQYDHFHNVTRRGIILKEKENEIRSSTRGQAKQLNAENPIDCKQEEKLEGTDIFGTRASKSIYRAYHHQENSSTGKVDELRIAANTTDQAICNTSSHPGNTYFTYPSSLPPPPPLPKFSPSAPVPPTLPENTALSLPVVLSENFPNASLPSRMDPLGRGMYNHLGPAPHAQSKGDSYPGGKVATSDNYHDQENLILKTEDQTQTHVMPCTYQYSNQPRKTTVASSQNQVEGNVLHQSNAQSSQRSFDHRSTTSSTRSRPLRSRARRMTNDLNKTTRTNHITRKRKRVNWTPEENERFMRLVLDNKHIGEATLRRMLAQSFSDKRSHEQCANHLRILRALKKLPPAFEGLHPTIQHVKQEDRLAGDKSGNDEVENYRRGEHTHDLSHACEQENVKKDGDDLHFEASGAEPGTE